MTDLMPGQVNIRGKIYETVALRVHKFREKHPEWTLQTKIHHSDEKSVVIEAQALDETGRLRANGHAEEVRGSSNINRTSALENCETSAIGRCLAALGLGGSEFASANEVQGAIAQQESIDVELKKRVIADTLSMLDSEDALGMREIWDELAHHEQQVVWGEFNTRQKAKIRELLQQAAKEQTECDTETGK